MSMYISSSDLSDYFGIPKDGLCDNCPNDIKKCKYIKEYTLMDICSAIDDLEEDLEIVKMAKMEHVHSESVDFYFCTWCHMHFKENKYKYCPNCGAMLKGRYQ